jgi:predicted nuclease with TOPRIM domain
LRGEFLKFMGRISKIMSRCALPAEYNITINTFVSYSQLQL